jgi:GGDEF domain-containing protein
MKNKFINVYGFVALMLLAAAVVWFGLSVTAETRKGVIEAERSFNWISRECSATAIADGFMSDAFIQKLTGMCNQSKLLAALVITTPQGTAFAWPERSSAITYDMHGNPSISNTSLFMKVYAAKLDIGGPDEGSIVMTASVYVLHPNAIFAASRNSFLAILTILFATLIVIFAVAPAKREARRNGGSSPKTGAQVQEPEPNADLMDFGEPTSNLSEEEFVPPEMSPLTDESYRNESEELSGDVSLFPMDEPSLGVAEDEAIAAGDESAQENDEGVPIDNAAPKPEGLFSPVTGIGWEQYLTERLDSELVRAASSEQDLSLIIIRISGLVHTDLLSRKIAKVLLDTFKFKDMVFEFGSNGFAGILQNITLDQAMKVADTLYAGIDSLLMEMSHGGQITIGITTRTARLLSASRMIEEALSAARKAEEEPSLPIVAFRANPEKYREFVAENNG